MCVCKIGNYSAAPRRKAKSQPLKAVKRKEIVVKHGNAGSEKSKQVYATYKEKRYNNLTNHEL